VIRACGNACGNACGSYGTVCAARVESRNGVSTAGSDALRRIVAAHVPGDAREEAAKVQFLSELDRLPSPCDRHADPVHVTASAVVVGERGTVLHLHRRLGRWLQPGGHVDSGEDPAHAAVRETREETGLPADHPDGGPALLHLDVHSANGHVHLDLRYLLVAPDVVPSPGTGESPYVRWFSWQEAVETADEALIGALRGARRWWEVWSASAGDAVSACMSEEARPHVE